MKFRIIIPARFESTRLPRKLLLKESGRELITYTVDVAVKACDLAPELFTGATVATDNEEILRVVEDYASENNLPIDAVMTRVDHPSGSDRIAEAVQKKCPEIEGIINLQGDEPELDPLILVDLAKMLADQSSLQMATYAYKLTVKEDILNPNLVKLVMGKDSQALYFSRAPIPYCRQNEGVAEEAWGHVGVYGYRRETLFDFVSLPAGKLEQLECLEQLRALENGIGIGVGVLNKKPPKGIDTREDYEAFLKSLLF